MIRTTYKNLLHLGFFLSSSILAPASQAGILNGHAAAFGGVAGAVPFNNGVGLSGTIDYAVFTAGAFNANFAGLGYVPGDALVYTYQVNVTGSLGVSAEIVGLANAANTIGTFNIGDQNASSASFTPNARWLFSPEIPTGMSSYGLAFSSPRLPIVGASLTIDGGTQALVAGVPTPGPINVPEPAAVLLVAGGVGAVVFSRRASQVRRSAYSILAVLGTLSLCAQASAASLSTTNFALNDGFGPDGGYWRGSASLAGSAATDSLSAVVQWAAFPPGQFQLFLNGESIAQVDPSGPNEITYVYQVTSVRLAVPGIDTVTVGVDPADARGSVSAPAFLHTGDANERSPASGGDNTTSMAWFFNGNEILSGETSSLLVFTSPNVPEFDFLQINSGLAGPVVSPLVASPSDRPIPEPASIILFLVCSAASLGRRKLSRRW
jgi:hypothetical protein